MKVGYFPEKQLSYEGNQPNKTKETIRMFWFSEIFSIDLKKNVFLRLNIEKRIELLISYCFHSLQQLLVISVHHCCHERRQLNQTVNIQKK